ncbi:MAG: hypothetical protein GWP12_01940 [Nitrospirae bacterium]|nr:hypothetical protein [Nitrospirota bacterium]
MIVCPTCGKLDCIQTAEDVLDSIYQLYLACGECLPEPGWDKTTPLIAQPGAQKINDDTLLCPSCGRRPLDAIMGQVLTIMQEHGDRDGDAKLANVGTPLITPGFPIMYPPRLGPDNLVIIADNIRQVGAEDIVNRVPEVKGVILRTGDQADSVGILDKDSEPHEYILLAGCDMRSDLAQTMLGELVIYKQQSRIHIEFNNQNKMGIIEQLDMKGLLAGAVVVDGMCGSGALGMMAMLSGARKVIFNDAWRPAIENLLLNIEVNQDIMDVQLESTISIKDLPLIGDEPVLVARAMRNDNNVAEIYFGDLRLLVDVIDTCDLCLIDTYPSADPSDFVTLWSEMTPNVIVV